MELHEAYEKVQQARIDGQVPDEFLVLFDTPDDNQLLRALRYKKIATAAGLWDCAEVIMDDPAVLDSPFCSTEEQKFTFLANDAAGYGDFDRARDYFSRAGLSITDSESLITRALIENNKLDEAIEAVSKVDYSYIAGSSEQRNLGAVVYKLCQRPSGPKQSLDLIKELVPNPETSGIDDKHLEHSRLDYYLEPIAPFAIEQNDFATAEEAVDMTMNWYGPGAAMGGGGLVDCAIDSTDNNVLPAVKTLMFRKWASGFLHQELTDCFDVIRPEVKARIAEWLQDIKTKDYEKSYAQNNRDNQIDEIDKLIALYTS